jgi:peptide/nickel transport system substrate-binding protein
MKLAFPSVSILQTLAHWQVSPVLMPREAEGGFDPRQTMRGSGPWMLTEYQPGIGYKLKRNPNFFRTDLALVDGIDLPIINEYVQGVAQLKAGNIYFYLLNSEDILQTKADVPALKMYAHSGYPANVGVTAVFDFRAGSVFRDERVRQAMSMLIDRDLFIDVRHNVTAFANAGLPVPKRWTTLLSSGEEDFWLDPQGSDFGENAKYFRHDIAEARKLLQAAGTGVIDQPVTLVAGQELGPAHKDEVEVLRGMWESTGDIKLRPNPVDFSTVFQPRYIVNSPRRDFEGKGGMVMANLPDQAEVDSMLAQYYSRGGGSYRFEPDFPNDARWDSLVQAQGVEFDETKRKALLHDLQRHAAAKAYTIHRPGWALGFGLIQPWVMNHGAFHYRLNLVGSGILLKYWLDEPQRSKQ